ncbi:hypothetical protein BC332_10775 [Capsicum chinense]|nr:hypothetical protein BC332_10775 [Capsicum chinense]
MERLHLGDVLTSSLSRPSSNLLRRDGRAASEKEWLPTNWMLTLYLSESYAKKDLLLVRLRPSVANSIIGTELILLTLPPETSSLRADQTFLLPSQADAEPHYLAALRSPRGGSGSDRRDKALLMVMKEGEMPG